MALRAVGAAPVAATWVVAAAAGGGVAAVVVGAAAAVGAATQVAAVAKFAVAGWGPENPGNGVPRTAHRPLGQGAGEACVVRLGMKLCTNTSAIALWMSWQVKSAPCAQ